jgi:hypothetical protein
MALALSIGVHATSPGPRESVPVRGR